MAELFPSQEEAATWLAMIGRGLLADGVRVGKTGAAIRACDHVDARNILWTTTGSARLKHAENWDDFQTLDRPIAPILSTSATLPPEGVVIVSYDVAQRIADALRARRWDAIVLDEAHRLKNRKIARTQVFYGERCDGVGGLVEPVENVFALTGTPMPNGDPRELWPMLRALIPAAIPSKRTGRTMGITEFSDRFCKFKHNGFGLTYIGPKNLDELKERLAPFFMRRTFEQVSGERPRITYDSQPVEATKHLAELRRMEREELKEQFRDLLDSVPDDEKLELVKQIDQSVRQRLDRLTGLAKAHAVVDLLRDEFEDGRGKIVLFAQHTEVIDVLRKGLEKFGALVVDGRTPAALRGKYQDWFQTDPKFNVFIGQLQAAGEAIDLSAADDALLVEASYVPKDNSQAAWRVMNINKKTPVRVRLAYLPGSVDERKQKALVRKLETIKYLFD